MKTFPALAFIAALTAFVIFPFQFELAGSLLFVAGLAAITVCDYSRVLRPLRASAEAPLRQKEKFGLAA